MLFFSSEGCLSAEKTIFGLSTNMQARAFSDLIKSAKKSKEHLPKVKMFLLGDTSLQFINQAIVGQAYENAINLEIKEFDFNAIELGIAQMDENSEKNHCDIICILENSYSLWNHFSALNNDEKLNFANRYLSKLTNQVNLLESKNHNNILIANFIEFDDSVWGSFANKTEVSFLYQLRKINWELLNLSMKRSSLNIFDLSSLSQQFGLSKIYDFRLFETASMIFSLDSLPAIAAKIVDFIRAMRGDLKKCIVLDLDNTLWNGVISEDGLSEIGLGDYNHGKSFEAFQKWLKMLKNRGVILTVCSKNDMEMAELPFLKHPQSVLKLDDFAVFLANWNSKVDNIREIQKRLNIGFSSMVFIDDNPFERNLIHEYIPEISVPHIPENPEDRLPFLMSLNLFETTSFTEEDVERVDFYRAEAQRNQVESEYTDTRKYLESLKMTATIESLNEFNIPRFSQLSIRSNQFNLRTLRYQTSDLKVIEKDQNRMVYCVSMRDAFGDYGLVSGVVIYLNKPNQSAFIESWFMSCRVLKRGLEQFVMNHLVHELSVLGLNEIHGEIIENQKNTLVYDFYKEFGFEKEDQIWKLKISNYKLQNTEIQ